MSSLVDWTLDTIRNDDPMMGWLEERRFDFMPQVQSSVKLMFEGATVILITDREREWLGSYIMNKLNDPKLNRPILPIVTLASMYPHYDSVQGGEGLDIIEDMLSVSYKENYFFWYIGRGEDRRADIAKRSDRNLLWVLDEEVQNSFMLHSHDKLLDFKLLHLYRLFDKTLDGALFGAFEL